MVLNELADLDTAHNSVRVDVGVQVYFLDPALKFGPVGDVPGEGVLDWKADIEFIGALDVQPHVEVERGGSYYLSEEASAIGMVDHFQRFTGTVRVDLDLSAFPFDTQVVTLRLGSLLWGDYACRFVLDDSKPPYFFPDMVKHLHEWEVISGPTVKETRVWMEEDLRHCSVIELECRLRRLTSFYTSNIFVVIFLLSIISWSTFLIAPDVLNDRLQISLTVFLALVAVNFVVAESLPRISHHTTLSKFFLFNYVSVAVGAVESGISFLINDIGGSFRAAKIVDWTFMGIMGASSILVFGWIMYRAWSLKRAAVRERDLKMRPKRD